MIQVKKDSCVVSGGGMEIMTELCLAINGVANSMKRHGADEKELRGFFHHLVDVALDAPDVGTTLDLSFRKEGGK